LLLNACRDNTNVTDVRKRHYAELLTNACTPSDLESKYIPLSVKLEFLRNNNLTKIASVMNSKFRNKIVHFQFEIADDLIVLNGENIMPSVLQDTNNMMVLLSAVGNVFRKVVK
jgi:hypothetical protein